MTTEFQQQWPAASSPKPITIIGAGGIVSDAHLPAYKKAGFEVVGLVDLERAKAQKLAQTWNIPSVYESVTDAVAADKDVVYDIAVPPTAITAILPHLPDGAAVLIQKPMGADLQQAREIRTICRAKSLQAAVNFQLRFAPMMMAVRDAVARGLLGELLEIEVHLNVYTPWHLFPFLIPMQRVEISVHSIHYLDTIRSIAGNPQGVFARSMRDPRAQQLAQTRTSVLLDYGKNLRGVMSINHNHQYGRKFQSAWFRFEGTEGAMMVKLGVIYDYPNGEPDELWFCSNDGQWEQIPLAGAWFIDAFIGPMTNVQRFAAGEDEQLLTGVEDAFQTMALVEACFKSLERPGEPLELD